MFNFQNKDELHAFVEKIKDEGLENVLRGFIQDENGRQLLSIVFSIAFDSLVDEDYEAFVRLVCEDIEERGIRG